MIDKHNMEIVEVICNKKDCNIWLEPIKDTATNRGYNNYREHIYVREEKI